MTEQEGERGDTKTCPACGGTWSLDRQFCLACGAKLDMVPARPADEAQGQEPINWDWLEAKADEGTASEATGPADAERNQGCLSRIFPG
jgi:hypothetical protein